MYLRPFRLSSDNAVLVVPADALKRGSPNRTSFCLLSDLSLFGVLAGEAIFTCGESFSIYALLLISPVKLCRSTLAQ